MVKRLTCNKLIAVQLRFEVVKLELNSKID